MPIASSKSKEIVLLFSAFLIAIAGLVYELLAGTVSSYLLGDSVYQFSLVIGLFMSAMGVGAFLSRYVNGDLPSAFIYLQILIAVLGGLSTPLLFYAFSHLQNYEPFLFLITLSLGVLLGIEIPLIMRILKNCFNLRVNVSNVLTADYIGALLAALLFPLVLVPRLGLLQTGFLFALMNVFVSAMAWQVFRQQLPQAKRLLALILVIGASLIWGFSQSKALMANTENALYQDEIIFAESSSYQRSVLTRRGERLRFYINGALQFDSYDEYRYHESLVHPAMSLLTHRERILVLGGGDGLAIRELLRYDDIGEIVLVDLDPKITTLFRENSLLTALNQQSLQHPKVKVINQDAEQYLQQDQSLYDLVVLDLPDPNNISLSRLYSASFYRLLSQHLSASGILVTQATSPLYARQAFWCIVHTLQSVFTTDNIVPYHNYIPSFSEWGFVMASRRRLDWNAFVNEEHLPKNLRYLNTQSAAAMRYFPPDMAEVSTAVNQLSTHSLLKYYENGWNQWFN